MANHERLDFDMLGSSDPNFWVDEKQTHKKLAENCIKLMSASLKEDICDVGIPGTLVVDIDRNRIGQYLSEEVQYACLHWIQHLQNSGTQLRDNDNIHKFLQKHLLHWLEALSWMQKMLEGIRAIIAFESFTAVRIWRYRE
jgi:hypothetical protein